MNTCNPECDTDVRLTTLDNGSFRFVVLGRPQLSLPQARTLVEAWEKQYSSWLEVKHYTAQVIVVKIDSKAFEKFYADDNSWEHDPRITPAVGLYHEICDLLEANA